MPVSAGFELLTPAHWGGGTLHIDPAPAPESSPATPAICGARLPRWRGLGATKRWKLWQQAQVEGDLFIIIFFFLVHLSQNMLGKNIILSIANVIPHNTPFWSGVQNREEKTWKAGCSTDGKAPAHSMCKTKWLFCLTLLQISHRKIKIQHTVPRDRAPPMLVTLIGEQASAPEQLSCALCCSTGNVWAARAPSEGVTALLFPKRNGHRPSKCCFEAVLLLSWGERRAGAAASITAGSPVQQGHSRRWKEQNKALQ